MHPTQQYCTTADVTKVMSAVGVSLRTDDDAAAMSDCIDEASTEIDGYCLLKYTQAMLALSPWVNKKCRIIAAFYLCSRRANPVPQSVQYRYEKAIEELEAVTRGERDIADCAQRKSSVPVLSNQRVILRPHPRTVTQPSRSTGTPQGYPQHVDPLDYNVD